MTPNERRLDTAKSILKNRQDINKNQTGWMATLAVSVTLFIVSILWAEYRTHNMHDCEERLYKKLVKEKYPFSKEDK